LAPDAVVNEKLAASTPVTEPYRASVFGNETVISDLRTSEPVAHFPGELNHITASSREPLWAGAEANHVCLIKLEQLDVSPPIQQ
jgi:hypothetical protein